MSFNPELLKSLLLTPDLSESQLINSIKELRNNFTSERSKIDTYLSSQRLISAYTYFYMPTNMPKLDFFFDQLNEQVLQEVYNSHFIDFGSGPGTFSMAFSKKSEKQVQVGLIDSSELMLKQAKSILDHFYPDNEYSFNRSVDQVDFNTDKKRTLLFGHSFNEMTPAEFNRVLKKVDPDFLLFIEPGTSEVFKNLMNMRSKLAEQFNIVYPCAGITQACPILKRGDWCHQVLKSSHHELTERLAQLASIDRRTQAVILHCYQKKNNPLEIKEEVTYVKYLKDTKFSVDFEVCRKNEDNQLELIRLQVLVKGLSVKEKKALKRINVGQRMVFDLVKKIKPDYWRVRLEL